MSFAKVMFVSPPPTLDWQPGSGLSIGGRRHPSTSVTGEQVYSYYNLSAAAVLREQGHQVFYVHCQTEGVSFEDLKKKFKELKPEFLVIMLEHITLSVSQSIAKAGRDEGMKVVFVGPMATAFGGQLVGVDADYIVRREWDYTLNNLITALSNGDELCEVKGISYKNNGELVQTEDAELIEDLDELPMPAYDLVDIPKFWESIFLYRPTATVVSSRGCPYECVFCSFPQTIFSRKFRAQSPERVLAEAKYLKENFGVKAIRYDDDTFDIDKNRVVRICELFRKEKLDLQWIIQSRPSLMTEEIAKELKSAGCTLVLFGVESGDDQVLAKINKSTTIEEIRRGVRIAQKAGLEILNCIMLGFYWDTEETLNKTIQFAFELNAEFTQFSTPIPLPGTEYYRLLSELGYISSKQWENADSFHHSNVDFPHLSNEYINNILKGIYKKYYLRPNYLWKMTKRAFRSKENFTQTLRLIRAFYQRWYQG